MTDFAAWRKAVLSAMARELPLELGRAVDAEGRTWALLAEGALAQLAQHQVEVDEPPSPDRIERSRAAAAKLGPPGKGLVSALEGDGLTAMSLDRDIAEFVREQAEGAPCGKMRAHQLASLAIISEDVKEPSENCATPDRTLTCEAFHRYLAEKRLDIGSDVRDIAILSNGYSKRTWLARMGDGNEFVVRQDTAFMQGAEVAAEFEVISALQGFGLPIPAALHLEPTSTDLGPPFMLMSRMPGTSFGDWFDGASSDPAVLNSIATVFGRLHSIDPAQLGGFDPLAGADNADRFQHQLHHYWERWRSATILPAPVVDAAYLLLREELQTGLGSPVVVHGDPSPWNFLMENGRVSALLDWEYAHVGDAAEDLAYIRDTVEAGMSWASFMDTYYAAGGAEVDDRRLRLFALWAALRNATLSAGIARTFLDDPTLSFKVGAVGYVSREMTIGKVRAAMLGCITSV